MGIAVVYKGFYQESWELEVHLEEMGTRGRITFLAKKYTLNQNNSTETVETFSIRNFGTIYYCQHPQFKSPKYAPDM